MCRVPLIKSAHQEAPNHGESYRSTILRKEVRTLEKKSTSPIGPRYSRGQEREDDAPHKHERPLFSRGFWRGGSSHDKQHEGNFAVGQEKAPHHPEWEYHGRYSRGQERSLQPGQERCEGPSPGC
jgi:hypothetical protein